MSKLLDGYLTEDELADHLNKSRRTIQRWRALGIGPPWTEVGDSIFYRIESVTKWIVDNERQPVRAA